MAEPLVPLGEIVATHGLLGWLKLNPFNFQTTALKVGIEVVVEKSGNRSVHGLESSSPHKHQWLIKLREVDSIDEAAKHIGATLSIAESALDPLPPGHYYHYQVIGFDVFDVSGEYLGTIRSTMSTSGGELYLVQGTAREHLLPAVKEIIEKVDFSNRTITVNPPAGLLDL